MRDRVSVSGTAQEACRAPRRRHELRCSSCALCGSYVSIPFVATVPAELSVRPSLHHLHPVDACPETGVTNQSVPRLLLCRHQRKALSSGQGTETLGLAPLRPEISFTGNAIVAPFVSSIRSARSWEWYAAKAARGSALAARRPAREARAKFARSSFSIQPGTRSDLLCWQARDGLHCRAAFVFPSSQPCRLTGCLSVTCRGGTGSRRFSVGGRRRTSCGAPEAQ
jgi:hypothetical protein